MSGYWVRKRRSRFRRLKFWAGIIGVLIIVTMMILMIIDIKSQLIEHQQNLEHKEIEVTFC